MDSFLKENLGYTFVKRSGEGGGGCINQGEMYHTDKGKIFVKENAKDGAEKMFIGELESLKAILDTGAIKVPTPIKVLQRPTGPGSILVMEYLEMRRCSNQAKLGQQLAELHLHNWRNKKAGVDHIESFGFHVETCCGFLPQGNTWNQSWVEFYTAKLQEQIDRQVGDQELQNQWSQLKPGMSSFFNKIDVFPSLLHGDLWSGNVGQIGADPVVFDPASFYGHHEYDLAIGKMFGGFGADFHNSYHQVIPKQEGFELRSDLYQLFHYLNHWNHFGDGYRSQSISIMKRLNKYLKYQQE